jgi:hypothetical protein
LAACKHNYGILLQCCSNYSPNVATLRHLSTMLFIANLHATGMHIGCCLSITTHLALAGYASVLVAVLVHDSLIKSIDELYVSN